MARVFRAVLQGPAGFEKTVAIKLLKSTATHRSAGDDFRREAVYASRIHHPNVVDVYELGEEEGCPFISMEWVNGQPLQKLLDPKSMPPPSVVLDLLIALLNGLEQAHIGSPESLRPGMLHRDIKPSNIIVSRHGVPKLVDFGIAAQMDANFGELLAPNGLVVGTINWMSPEQIQGQPLDERSDLFSFGLVMAAMVLCRSPLRRRYMHELIQEGKPIPQCLISIEDETALDGHIAGFGSLVAGVLSRDPGQRPRTARDLRKRLEELRPTVGHRPTLPQWMSDRRSEGDPEPPQKLNNETTWVMGRTGRFHEAQTAPVAAGNVPTDNSLFIGRTAESAELERHLSNGERLVTLVGTGGAGKTRLSRRIANRFSEQLAGGAWFVDLSDVHSEDGIVQAVAKAMGLQLPDDGAHPSVDQLAEVMATRDRVLVVLDNFEQLVSHGPATVGQWINKAPLAQFLVTTREGLMLPEEVQVPLNPLSQDEAIELLHQRARLAGAEWTENAQNRGALLNIVEALDRLPLAIELAAARARFLTPEGLHERLEERFKLLQSGVRGGSDRQANLHNLIDWSWQRLEPWEQSTLAQLSCFRGGFSMEAAEAVVNLSAWPNAPWALDAVGALLDKSLLHTQSIDDKPRLFMYLSIRDFAAERLVEDNAPTTGDAVAGAVSARHAEYFAGFSPVEPTGNLRLVVPTVRKQLDANFDNLLARSK
jgi:predicted ATPase